MSFFKNIRVELFFLLIISLSIFISFSLDLAVYNYFKNFSESLNNIYLKEFFVEADNSFEIIPDIGINLIRKVINPHIIIPAHIIFFYPI